MQQYEKIIIGAGLYGLYSALFCAKRGQHVLVLISKNKWNSLFLLTVTLIMLPVNSALYCGMYIVPVFLFYLYRNDMEKNKWFLLLFFVFLCPIQIVVKTLSVNYLISNIIIDFAWIFILIRESPILIKITRKILAQ